MSPSRRRPAAAHMLDGWRERAACTGRGHLMSPPEELAARYEPIARQVCDGCPVRQECGAWVLDLTDRDDPGGIVAGMSEAARSRVRKLTRALNTLTAIENGDTVQ